MGDVERVMPDQVVTAEQRAEAEEATEMVRSGATAMWEGMVRIVQCNGWLAMGYRSFRQWLHEEIGMTFSTADRRIARAKILMELQAETGLPIAELDAKTPANRPRKTAPPSPVVSSMKSASRRLAACPALVNPDELRLARELRDHLDRLLG